MQERKEKVHLCGMWRRLAIVRYTSNKEEKEESQEAGGKKGKAAKASLSSELTSQEFQILPTTISHADGHSLRW